MEDRDMAKPKPKKPNRARLRKAKQKARAAELRMLIRAAFIDHQIEAQAEVLMAAVRAAVRKIAAQLILIQNRPPKQ
jgi:hypothetical protein